MSSVDTDPAGFDRMLEISLAEVVGERAPPDLVAEVCANLDAESARSPRRRRSTRRRGAPLDRRPVWQIVAAAAVLVSAVVFGVVQWLSDPETQPEPAIVAVAENEVRTTRPGGAGQRSLSIRENDLVTAIAAVDLRMPNGDAPTAVLHVSHEGVVQVLSATRCRVVRGEFTVDGSLAVELAGSRHTIALDARSKVTLNVVREPTSMDDTRVAEELAAGTLPPADVVHLEVVAGEVRLLPDGTALHVGDRVEFQPNAKPVIDFALQPDDLVKVDDWLRQLQITDASIDIKTADGIKTSKARIKAHADLMDFLGQSARRWTELGTRVGDVIAARPANDVRGRLYAVLAQDPDPRTHRRLLSKMLNEPAQLGSRAVVILADRPASPGDPERDWTAQVYEVLRGASRRGELPLLPAVWLTLHGDRRGLAVVRNLSRMPIMVRAKPEMYLGSVLALSRMGESTVWSDARDVAEREVDSYLRDGDLQRARSLCLKVAWFHGYLESERPPAVGDIERRLDVMVRGRTNELGHAAAIRRRMAELTH